MEPKYVTLDEVVRKFIEVEEKKTLQERLAPYLNFKCDPIRDQVIDPYSGDPIITEDIDCEIVENKKLTNGESSSDSK